MHLSFIYEGLLLSSFKVSLHYKPNLHGTVSVPLLYHSLPFLASLFLGFIFLCNSILFFFLPTVLTVLRSD